MQNNNKRINIKVKGTSYEKDDDGKQVTYYELDLWNMEKHYITSIRYRNATDFYKEMKKEFEKSGYKAELSQLPTLPHGFVFNRFADDVVSERIEALNKLFAVYSNN